MRRLRDPTAISCEYGGTIAIVLLLAGCCAQRQDHGSYVGRTGTFSGTRDAVAVGIEATGISLESGNHLNVESGAAITSIKVIKVIGDMAFCERITGPYPTVGSFVFLTHDK